MYTAPASDLYPITDASRLPVPLIYVEHVKITPAPYGLFRRLDELRLQNLIDNEPEDLLYAQWFSSSPHGLSSTQNGGDGGWLQNVGKWLGSRQEWYRYALFLASVMMSAEQRSPVEVLSAAMCYLDMLVDEGSRPKTFIYPAEHQELRAALYQCFLQWVRDRWTLPGQIYNYVGLVKSRYFELVELSHATNMASLTTEDVRAHCLHMMIAHREVYGCAKFLATYIPGGDAHPDLESILRASAATFRAFLQSYNSPSGIQDHGWANEVSLELLPMETPGVLDIRVQPYQRAERSWDGAVTLYTQGTRSNTYVQIEAVQDYAYIRGIVHRWCRSRGLDPGLCILYGGAAVYLHGLTSRLSRIDLLHPLLRDFECSRVVDDCGNNMPVYAGPCIAIPPICQVCVEQSGLLFQTRESLYAYYISLNNPSHADLIDRIREILPVKR